MYTELLNLSLGFLEGFALILSPCILPILPIILAGSLTGSKKRPLGIVTGFILTFAVFTFFSRKLVYYTGLDLNLIREASYGLLLLFGLIMMSTFLTEKFTQLTRGFATVGSRFSFINDPEAGFSSGLLFGGLVALIWTPCAGPILAAVIVQTVLQQSNALSFFIMLAFAIGAAVPMLLIALFGRKIMANLSFLNKHSVLLRKLLGTIIVATVAYLLYSDNSIRVSSALETPRKTASTLEEGLATPYPAPPITGISAWINSAPLQLEELKGKVVLIDFWTYSCINCIRTLPYLKSWYQKYHDQGLVIIGIHTPEFDFEKDLDNVKNAVKQDQIQYPVALDNQFATWRSFNNSYWPAHYLIDKDGYVVYTHFGEGAYEVTENNIRFLLGLKRTATPPSPQANASRVTTPETYLGYARAENFSSIEAADKDSVASYHYPVQLKINDWALQGQWKIKADRIVSRGEKASLEIHFKAKKVYIVMGSSSGLSIPVNLTLNGRLLSAEQGSDVVNSIIHVRQHALYEAIQLPQFGEGVLELSSTVAGLEIYTFTFGN